MSTSISNNTNSAIWSNGLTSFVKDVLQSDNIPQGITQGECVILNPPAKSLVSDWTTATGNLFVLLLTTGSIVDVKIDYTVTAEFIASPVTGVSTCTLGSAYYLALDGVTSNKIQPVALTSTH